MSPAHRLKNFALAVAAIASGSFAGGATADRSARVAQWVSMATQGVDERATQALAQMPDPARRLLALRGYLRAGDSVAARWSWSQERIDAYPETQEGKAAAADIEAVRVAFANANPGFTVDANREPRSFELQLSRWNSNASVSQTAAALVKFMSDKFPAREPQTASAQAVRDALTAWSPPAAATLAVPGLSAHGQGRAYDFRVMEGARIVAGTDVASARLRWDAAGWTMRLSAAVAAAGVPFRGPLRIPYEPWHYAYSPAP